MKPQQITDPDELRDCLAIRRLVFVDEQNVPQDLEVDGLDPAALHFAVKAEGKIIATCRVRKIGSAAKIERVAVLKEFRGQGIGNILMKYILQELPKKGDIHLFKLGAQTDAVPFYEKLGFKVHGNEYMDAGIPHLDMVKEI